MSERNFQCCICNEEFVCVAKFDRLVHCVDCNRVRCSNCCDDDDHYPCPTPGKSMDDHNDDEYFKCKYCKLILKNGFDNSGMRINIEDHLFNIHHVFLCNHCNLFLQDKEEQVDHLLTNRDCLAAMVSDYQISLFRMILEVLQDKKKKNKPEN